MESSVITQDDLVSEPNFLFMCMFKDLHTGKYGLNVTTNRTVFGFLLEENPDTISPVGGILSDIQVEQLCNHLTAYLANHA